METIKAVKIVKFIDHIINHKTGHLELSDLETPVNANFPHDLFAGYILLALQHEGRRHSRFREPPGLVIKEFRSLLSGGGNFVQASRTIAQHLYTTMSSYRTQVKPGDLMLALFNDADVPSGPTYLALLKLEPSDDVVREVKIVDGKRQVIFTHSTVRIPEPTSIHKIAVIDAEKRATRPYDVVLLDNDIRRKGIARFFYDNFLESDLVRTSSEGTRLLLEDLKDFIADHGDVVTPVLQPREKLEILERAGEIISTEPEVTLSDFVNHSVMLLTRPPADVQTIRTQLIATYGTKKKPEEQIGPQETIVIHPAEAARLTERAVYLLDNGVKIEGKRGAVEGLLEIDDKLDAQGRTTITIRTSTFKPS